MVNGSAPVHERECTHAVCVQKDTCEATGKYESNHNGTHTYTCTEGHTVTENCSGGTATCMAAAVCQHCGGSYGREDPDNHNWGEYTSKGDGKHTRICKDNSSHTETGNCSGGTATCMEAKTCSVCHTKYGSTAPDNHNWGEYTSNGDGTHTRICGYNTSHTETGDCSGGTATCTEAKTCSVCHTKYGSALGHDWDYIANGNGTHTLQCKRDQAHTETKNCSGGTATCTALAVCETCHTGYGSTEPDKHNWGEYTSNGNGKHTRICGYNPSHTETDDCSGGTATCTEAKTCSVCHTKYGSALGHDWDYIANGNGTHALKCKRDPSHTETDDCSGGTATCIAPAVCEYCNTAYGELDPDHHGKSVTVPGVAPTYTKTGLTEGAVCGDCGTVLIEQEIIPMLPPQTGDPSRLVLWLTLMAASLTGLALLMHRRRKA